jgi:hypothetical protein
MRHYQAALQAIEPFVEIGQWLFARSPELLALLGLLLAVAAGVVLWGAIATVIWIAA